MTISIEIKFKVGVQVFRKCDPDKNLYFVTNYVVDEKDVLYRISGSDGVFTVYHFEIANFEQRFADLN